jgi:hypothetical protein
VWSWAVARIAFCGLDRGPNFLTQYFRILRESRSAGAVKQRQFLSGGMAIFVRILRFVASLAARRVVKLVEMGC